MRISVVYFEDCDPHRISTSEYILLYVRQLVRIDRVKRVFVTVGEGNRK